MHKAALDDTEPPGPLAAARMLLHRLQQQGCASTSIKVQQDAWGGLGLFAAAPLAEGEQLLAMARFEMRSAVKAPYRPEDAAVIAQARHDTGAARASCRQFTAGGTCASSDAA